MLSLLIASALAFTEADANIAYKAADGLVSNHTPRDAGTLRGRAAANYILDTASSVGADAKLDSFVAQSPLGSRYFTNVTAEWVVNPTSKWVVVVSHYDTKHGVPCPGANDGASTSGLLVGLSNALTDWRDPRCNVMLLWLDAEECVHAYLEDDGFQGSKHAAASLKASGRNVAAVICVDMLGDRDLRIGIPRNSSPELRKTALKAATTTGHADKVYEMEELVKDDHMPFLDVGFRAIDLIDFYYGSAPGLNDYWHTDEDTIDKISERSLLVSGQIVCEMINILSR